MTKPIAANHGQSFEKTSILIFLYTHKIIKGSDPNKTLINAIVIGPNESVANLILKKAEAQTTPRKTNKE